MRWLHSVLLSDRVFVAEWLWERHVGYVSDSDWIREWGWQTIRLIELPSETGMASCISGSDIVGYINIWTIDFWFAEWQGKRHTEYFYILQHIERWLTGKRLNCISVSTWLTSCLITDLFITETVFRMTAFRIVCIPVQIHSTNSDGWLK